MGIFKRIAINTLGFMLIAYLLPGVIVESWGVAFTASIILALLNLTVKPVLYLFTLPINFFTFGLFSFVINALIVMMTAKFVGSGIYISSFGTGLLVSVLLTLFQRFIEEVTEE